MGGQLKKRPEPIEVDGVLMREVLQKSPVPCYGVGAVWLLYALVFPLYRWFDFLIATAVSLGVYFVLGLLLKGKTVLVPVELPPVNTGSSLADQVIAEGREILRELRETGAQLPSAALKQKIARMTSVAGKIINYVGENPEKATSVRQFLNYYLPTMSDLLKSYTKLDRLDVKGKNIDSAMLEIEQVMDTVNPAFEKQLDALYQDEALDASVDIEVLRTMLAQGGLTDSDFQSKN